MLILTRSLQETVCIGDDIKVTILGVKGNQVRVGIAAPRDVLVLREELTPGYDPDQNSHSTKRQD